MSLSKKQEAMRRVAVGASEIAVLAGLSKWRTPIALFERKMGLHTEEVGLPADLGNLLEEPLAKLYAERTGTERRLARCDSLTHPVKTFALATPDRIVFPVPRVTRAKVHEVAELRDAQRNVQIKSTSWRMAHEWGRPGTDQVPEEYLVQVVWEMGVTGLAETDVAVLFDKDRFDIYRVAFDEQLWAGLLEIAERFVVDHLLTGTPPPPDASQKYAEYLGRAFGRATLPLRVVDPGTELEEQVRRYALLKSAETRLKRHLKLTANKLKAEIGEAGGLAGPFGELKWLRSPPKRVADADAVATELEALAGLAIGGMKAGPEQADLVELLRSVRTRHQKDGRKFDQLRTSWAAGVQEDLDELELKLARIEQGDTQTEGDE
jgi:putative phage-type endonuclease